MTEEPKIKIGEVAVKRGLITSEQLKRALEEHENRSEEGSRLPLGELLVDMGFITPHQLKTIVSAQGAPRQTSRKIEGFSLIKKLGDGGMGSTYLARQLSMDRLVAIKVLKKNLSRDSTYIQRFMSEAKLAGALNHENNVSMYDVGQSSGFYYLVMEYVDGKNLRDMLDESGAPLEEEFALTVTLQTTKAIDHAHRLGIIHSDIKPDNIILNREKTAKLCDFGLARESNAEAHLTQDGMMIGTPHYASPEQAKGSKDLDIRTDIYSLGATLYHLISGQTPFSGPSAAVIMTQHITKQIPSPKEVNPDISHNTCMLLQKMTYRERDKRYKDPADLIIDLECVIAGEFPVSIRQQQPAARRKRTSSIRAPKVEHAARPLRPTRDHGEKKSSFPAVWIAAGIPAVLIAGLLLVLFLDKGEDTETSGSAEPEQGKPETPETEDTGSGYKSMYEQAAHFWSSNPELYADAIRRFRRIRRKAGNTVWAEKAAERIREIAKARKEAGMKEFKRILEQARAHASSGNYDKALAVFGSIPQQFSRLLAADVQAETMKIRNRARHKTDRIAASVRKLIEQKKFGEALEILKRSESIAYAPSSSVFSRLKKQAREQQAAALKTKKQREAEEARLFQKRILDEFETSVFSGNLSGFTDFLRQQKQNLTPGRRAIIGPLLTALESVSGEIEKRNRGRMSALRSLKGKKVSLKKKDGRTVSGPVVSVHGEYMEIEVTMSMGGAHAVAREKVRFKDLRPGQFRKVLPPYHPKTPVQYTAAAVMMLAKRKYGPADRLLDAAGDYALAVRLKSRLAVLQKKQMEAGAETVWKEEIMPLVRDEYTSSQVRKLESALKKYGEEFSSTEFGRSKEAEMQKLRADAELKIKLARRPKQWAGRWKEEKAELRYNGHASHAFDTKRNRYMLCVQSMTVWAFNMKDSSWKRLCTSPVGRPGMPGSILADQGAVYVEKRDWLVVNGHGGAYCFDVGKSEWSKLSARAMALNPGLAYGEGRLLGLGYGSDKIGKRGWGLFMGELDMEKLEWKPVTGKLPPIPTYPKGIFVYCSGVRKFITYGSYRA